MNKKTWYQLLNICALTLNKKMKNNEMNIKSVTSTSSIFQKLYQSRRSLQCFLLMQRTRRNCMITADKGKIDNSAGDVFVMQLVIICWGCSSGKGNIAFPVFSYASFNTTTGRIRAFDVDIFAVASWNPSVSPHSDWKIHQLFYPLSQLSHHHIQRSPIDNNTL